ncbi:7067_t:CDS:2 [Acaulospora morrowiae]|uniref:7067_t:CDS:1 n=1 Tax=Acaulospora morrowiae TaxID=94023 RepID=A0A9N8VCW5_9GLOM|nr:7067_t:CDS:2 [Acaulospora morrowiae]
MIMIISFIGENKASGTCVLKEVCLEKGLPANVNPRIRGMIRDDPPNGDEHYDTYDTYDESSKP